MYTAKKTTKIVIDKSNPLNPYRVKTYRGARCTGSVWKKTRKEAQKFAGDWKK